MSVITKPKLIVITGATAAGKSAFIYTHLRSLPLSIINADSRQVYRGIAIAAASPTAEEELLFPHALYNFLPFDANFSAGEFLRVAEREIQKAHEANKVPLICGGTYFYIHALFHGLLPSMEIPPSITQEVAALSDTAAYAKLLQLDAKAAEQNHPHNAVRVRRALSLCLAHGGPISALAKVGGIYNDYDIQLFIFDAPRALLKERAITRSQKMLDAGLIREIEQLFSESARARKETAWQKIPALTGIGIREFFEMYEKTEKTPQQLSSQEIHTIKENIIQNTMRLVKRQQTWFRNAAPKPKDTKIVDPSFEYAHIATLVKEFILPAS
ncbi:MAG TPA: tRNA (adenosine(37)-N6)-dimethylallyltransferase MiaA [Turneriella sp.]|nr:tRNA (adenosine(37)-N6)-dimethylallyltransferase MiaA [Turneriella sp.]